MKIYQALYCNCVHDSSYATLSVHKTEKGAIKAMEEHKQGELNSFNKMFRNKEDNWSDMEFGTHEDWQINEIELLD